ncbi:MAG: dihydroorotase [Candidatus Methylomirabilales bacterium]
MRILIRGGRVIDPASGLDGVMDLLIEEGVIRRVGAPANAGKPRRAAPGGTVPEQADRVIEAKGLVVCPGLIDLHVHLREPGREDEETIASGTAAAARGGFTGIACMPNTEPPNDSASVTEFILEEAARHGVVRVYPIGAISKGRKGEELAEIGELVAAGCVGISDDGSPVASAGLMRRAMEYATMFDVPVIPHCEELTLSQGGVMHEGLVSTQLGLKGIPGVAEAVEVARDLLLAEFTGARLHLCHLSAAESVQALREAKARGVKVTAEVTPHHLALTDEAVRGFSTNTKMNPPLRSAEDQAALREALADGTIDAIATDHAPHALAEKEQEYDAAPFGVTGLETCLGVVLTELYHGKVLSLPQIVERMSVAPARILGLKGRGSLAPGTEADVTLLDPEREWVAEPKGMASKSKNSPFLGWKLKGAPVMTIVGGKVVWEA